LIQVKVAPRSPRDAAVMRRSALSRLAPVAFALLLTGATGFGTAARAQDSGDPIVTARLFAEIEPGAPIAVEPRDDSDENLKLRDGIVAALQAQGHASVPAAGAALVLRFATDHVTDTVMQRVKPEDRRRAPGARFPMIRDELGTSMPLQTQTPSPVRETDSGVVKYRLQATLEGRADGQVLWRGEALGAVKVNETDEASLGRELSGALMAAFGRTVERQP